MKDEMWLVYLTTLSENEELYNSLTSKEKRIIRKYRKTCKEYIYY